MTGSTVLVKNPRSELYAYARAQAADGNECTTSFQLDNQVIEISECDVVSNFYPYMMIGRSLPYHMVDSFSGESGIFFCIIFVPLFDEIHVSNQYNPK